MCLLCSTQPHCFIEGNKERKKERDLHSVPETKYHQFMVEWLRRNICLQSRLRTTHDLHIKDSKSDFMHLHKMFYLFFVKQQQQQLNMWNMRVERFLLNRKIKFARRGSRRCNSKYDWIFHGRSIYYRSKIDSQIRLVCNCETNALVLLLPMWKKYHSYFVHITCTYCVFELLKVIQFSVRQTKEPWINVLVSQYWRELKAMFQTPFFHFQT